MPSKPKAPRPPEAKVPKNVDDRPASVKGIGYWVPGYYP